MSQRRDEEQVFELIKLVIYILIILTILGIIVASWACRSAVKSSLAVERRLSAGDSARESHATAFAWGWFLLFSLLGLATLNPLAAVSAAVFGLIVARLVYVAVESRHAAAIAAGRPGALVLGEVVDTGWGTSYPYTISPEERGQHILVIGPTGSGKTALSSGLISQDVESGVGLCVVDPKDDLGDRLMSIIPAERVDDVIAFDPREEAAVGFSPLAGVPPAQWTLATSELFSVFERYFGGSWTSRQAHVMRMALLALLSHDGSSLLDVQRVFLHENFRRELAFGCPNPAVRDFFLREYDIMWKRPDVVQPLLHKLSVFSTYPEVRAIFGQAKPKLDFAKLVNDGQILLVRSASGVVGPEVADLLCSLVVLRLQLECHRRAAVDESHRRFFALWVGEASHVESGALTRLINESRGFKLAASLLTQSEKFFSPELQTALVSNVGTTLRTFQREGGYWLEVQRLSADEPIVFPHPGPLPPADPVRVKRIRDRSRARYGQLPSSHDVPMALPITASGETAGTRPVLVPLGVDCDEE